MQYTTKQIKESIKYLHSQGVKTPRVGFVLGSGLGNFVHNFAGCLSIPYENIPYFATSTVKGHAGNLVQFPLSSDKGYAIGMQGRLHYYEGHTIEAVTYPIQLMKALGVEILILTTASGGINPKFKAGDLMLITDHINMFFRNPLNGVLSLDRFVDMYNCYDLELRELALKVALEEKIPLREGVFVGMTGPTYETPAEIRMLSRLGGDAISMSTVPEVLMARYLGIKVLGISCIANPAAGVGGKNKLNHKEVIEVTRKAHSTFTRLLSGILEKL